MSAEKLLISNKIVRTNGTPFGPDDMYCSMWCLPDPAVLDASGWTPQYNDWHRAAKLDDGGANLNYK